ncbi:hypothetical protein Rhe02_00640 [Rhizocola hellebori]|uniref:Uncharacterized protein n=2 Tax=Rhizocola hellebori TaxID=1392758 RepID=A0A8J3Q1Z5_9ACTN|nr:hypothetical protein Rhe02_00640 [Rhizocola hellebori]
MLRAYRERMWDLDVVERAEAIVRESRRQQVSQALEETLTRLDEAVQAANNAHDGTDVVAMIDAEQQLCAAQHVAQTLLRRHLDETRAADQVQAAYSAHRNEVSQRIKSIEIMLARQRITGL